MKSNIFLIDIDGVACAHAEAICKWVNEKYKIDSKFEDVTTWDHDFGPITFTEAVKLCYPDENFILNMEVTCGFHEFLQHMAKLTRVKFTTTRKGPQDATRLWIKGKFGDGFEVIFVNRKTEVNFDYLLDDDPSEVELAATKGRISFLITRPWNNNNGTMKLISRYPKYIYFIQDFQEIINFFNNYLSYPNNSSNNF